MLFGAPAARPINTWPLWKYLLIGFIFVFGVVYALPNMFGEDPALQISGQRGKEIAPERITEVETALKEAKLAYKSVEQDGGTWLIRFSDTDVQLLAQSVARKTLGDDVNVALNLAPATPGWLRAIGASPMKLGLDLRGGVHFLMEIDMPTAMAKKETQYVDDFKTELRKENIRYASAQRRPQGGVQVKFRDEATQASGEVVLKRQFPDLIFTESRDGEFYVIDAVMSDAVLKTARSEAVQQNLSILRNRVNELGVAEPLIQQQGSERLVVQLPGVQDSARAKEILSATATLEFRLVNEDKDVRDALAGRVPADSEVLMDESGRPYLLKKQVILTGDHITGASQGLDQNGLPNVNISLDSKGGSKMSAATKNAVGKLMASVLIEYKTEYEEKDGQLIAKPPKKIERVVNAATIQSQLGNRFQITGIGSAAEAQNLALVLRSGALIAPIQIVEERTIGPSMGQANIDMGLKAMVASIIAVMGFMLLKYRVFGIATNVALFMNLVLTVAVMSLIDAVLTMPGIAGLVLGLAMAVDANVLINERIREDIRAGITPQMAIKMGYDEASMAITDSNLTNLISGLVLFGVGSGTIKGFAVTMCIGILASMFTAVAGTRAIINAVYGGRDVKKLWI